MSIPTDPKFIKLRKTLQHLESKVRVRVGGLVFDDPDEPTGLMLVEHAGIWSDEPFWTPPGGGVEFGESLKEALIREVREETDLEIEIGPLRYVLDFIRMPLHAVSFYFECRAIDGSGALSTGADPELGADQLIRTVRMVAFDELGKLNVYPEGFAKRLGADSRNGFPGGTQNLGTLH